MPVINKLLLLLHGRYSDEARSRVKRRLISCTNASSEEIEGLKYEAREIEADIYLLVRALEPCIGSLNIQSVRLCAYNDTVKSADKTDAPIISSLRDEVKLEAIAQMGNKLPRNFRFGQQFAEPFRIKVYKYSHH